MANISTFAGAQVKGSIPLVGEVATYNITGAAKLIKVGPGRIGKITTIVAGSTAGTINDVATTGAAAVGNQIGVIPNTAANVVEYNWPFDKGLVIVPGTGQVLAVSFL
jgi:hypothetical protein